MSLTATLFQTTLQMVADVPVMPLVRSVLSLFLCAGLLMLFRPLLTGIVRALVLVVKPRMTKEQLAARRQMRDA